MGHHSLGTLQLSIVSFKTVISWAYLIASRTMAFVYTFPPPIKVLPPVPIPCQHASNSEGTRTLLRLV